MIEVNNLSKKYNGQVVLNLPHLKIPRGQSFGLVGNNGAGKTTFFNLLLDLIKPSTGYISNKGMKVNQTEEWKKHTSAYIDESFLIGYLTPQEYFEFIGKLRGWDKEKLTSFIDRYKEFFNDEILGQQKYIRDLSKGNQKKVGLIAALIGKPEVIVLDEPFANLDPTTQIRLKKILKDLVQDREQTLLISSHDLGHITEVTDRIVVLDKGNMVKDMPSSPEVLNELEAFFNA